MYPFTTTDLASEINRFDSHSALADATPPPASWYLEPAFLSLEKETVFKNHWLFVGHQDQVAKPGDFFTGNFLGRPYLVTRNLEGNIQAFYNVCAHHGTRVASGCGNQKHLTCPYHGWQYHMDGRLKKAPLAGAISELRKRAPGLPPLPITTWGPFLLVHFGAQPQPLDTLFQSLNAELPALNMDALKHVATRTYEMNCNWKVFVDNYLDGGYHVPHMHPDLSEGLDFKCYQSRLGDIYSVQTCSANGEETRLGEKAHYYWIYPNFMINRYGPWMDTNFVIPTGHDRCVVVFDYFYEGELEEAVLARELESSHQVQEEDMAIIDMVQEGLGSGVYKGLYAPRFEAPMYHFHQILHQELQKGMKI